MLQGKKAGERVRGYEWGEMCLSAGATVGLSAVKVKRKRWGSSALWEETQRGIAGGHVTTEALKRDGARTHSQGSGHTGSVSHIAQQNVTVMHKSSEETEKDRVRMLRDGIYGSSAIC